MQTEENMATEIAEVNLSYLILAQRILRQDRATGLFRLGINEEVADILTSLRPSQILKVASTGSLICHMRSAETTVWSLLAEHAKSEDMTGDGTAERLHARILMAGQHDEVVK